ncbi:hypothetical protein Prudu_739S000200 [Prunus dulcis]|uniref:Terpene synthase metal-binding domain-containing protein n=1 Tax=Prunus dulcis TaxID=3755 RepID=A0A5H2XQ22_PRUDU|nr:hypothetical protein Prudu_739S000200 [Prunus dulcis]
MGVLLCVLLRTTPDKVKLAGQEAEQERGDAPSAILCYMREMNASEDTAEAKIKGMIDNAWKKINGTCLRTHNNCLFSHHSSTTLPQILQEWRTAFTKLEMDLVIKNKLSADPVCAS